MRKGPGVQTRARPLSVQKNAPPHDGAFSFQPLAVTLSGVISTMILSSPGCRKG